jgi:hypothetical protein
MQHLTAQDAELTAPPYADPPAGEERHLAATTGGRNQF